MRDDQRARWREDAERPSAPVSQRILRELLWYLEEKGYAVTQGLTDAQLTEAFNAYGIIETIDVLMEKANVKLDGRKVARFKIKSQRGYLKLAPASSWIENWGGKISIAYDNGVSPARAGKPKLRVWLQVEFNRRVARELVGRPAFLAQIKEARHLDHDLESDNWIGVSTPLHKLIGLESEPILETQADPIAHWAHGQLATLLALKPGRKATRSN